MDMAKPQPVEKSTEIHSVILNLNENFANNKGSSFSTIVNRQLEIKPNTLVALYKGNIVRKPIVLINDATVTINTKKTCFPQDSESTLWNVSPQLAIVRDSLKDANPDEGYTTGDLYKDVDAVIPRGRYSKLEFVRTLVGRLNIALQLTNGRRVITGYQPSAGYDASIRFPYRFVYEEKNGEMFIGLRYDVVPPDFAVTSDVNFYYNAVTFIDLDAPFSSTNDVDFEGGSLEVTTGRGIYSTTPNTDWSSWGFGNSPLRPLSYVNSSFKDPDYLTADDVCFTEAHIRCPTSNTTNEKSVVFGLHNTYFAEESLGTTNIPASGNIVNSDIINAAPDILVGTRLTSHPSNENDGTVTLYCNEQLFASDFSTSFVSSANRDSLNGSANVLLHEFNLNQYGLTNEQGIKLRYEVYCQDDIIDYSQSSLGVVMPKRKYYMRILMSTPYEDNYQVIYDTKNYGKALRPSVVESGVFFQLLQSYSDPTKNTSGGLQPVVFFYDSTVDDWRVSNIRASNIANLNKYDTGTPAEDWAILMPCEGYSMSTSTKEMENIIRVTSDNQKGLLSPISTFFNPNCYPKNAEDGGMTSLGSDLSRYNIELNLPIKAYNSTNNDNNDIGQTRTIVFNTDPVIEETGNYRAGIVNKNIQPPDIKFLSLNNPDAIKLNELRVTIRDAKTNKIAEEISDAGIELLFKSE